MPQLFGKRIAYQTFCETCYFKRIAEKTCGATRHWPILQERWIAQQGRCTYTGEQLVLGENASLDHVLPKLRFPEKIAESSNLEWVMTAINKLKGDRTKAEFLRHLQQAVEIMERVVAHQTSFA